MGQNQPPHLSTIMPHAPSSFLYVYIYIDCTKTYNYTIIIISGQRARNVRLMCRGIKVSAVAAVALDGFVSVQCSRDSINEDVFCDFLEQHLLPYLLPFNGVNPQSVVLLDNASIHHTTRPVELIQSVVH